MKINISICEVIIGALILLFALWGTPLSKWAVVTLAVILIAHAFNCRVCCAKR